MANEQPPQQVDFDAEFEEAKKRYSFDFDGAIAAGYSKPQILAHVKQTSPEKGWYRFKRGVKEKVRDIPFLTAGGTARAFREHQRETGQATADIGDVIRNAPAVAYKELGLKSVADAPGKLMSRFAPSSDKPLFPEGRRMKSVAQAAEKVSPMAGGAVGEASKTIEGLTSPKAITTAGALMVPGVGEVVLASMIPELGIGAWEGTIDTYRKGVGSLFEKDPEKRAQMQKEAGAAAVGAATAGGMLLGGAKHMKARKEARAQRSRVKAEAEAKKAAEEQFNREWDAADKIRDREVDMTGHKAKARTMPEPRRVIPKYQTRPQDVIRLNEEAAGVPSGEPIPLGPRAPRRVIIRKPGEVEVVPTKIDVSDVPGIYPRTPDIEVPGTRGIAETMEMPLDEPRRVLSRGGEPEIAPPKEQARPFTDAVMLEDADIADLVNKGALPEWARPKPAQKPIFNDTPVGDIIRERGLSPSGPEDIGEVQRLKDMGVKGTKMRGGGRTLDEITERMGEEEGGLERPSISEALEQAELEQMGLREGKRTPANDAAITQMENELAEKILESEQMAKSLGIEETVAEPDFLKEPIKATFSEQAAKQALKPKRRSKAASNAEKRAYLEDIAREQGIAESETAGMTTRQLVKYLVKKGVPKLGLQLETRSLREQAMQRAVERELARRAGKQVVEKAPTALAAGAVGKKSAIAPNPLAETPSVEGAMSFKGAKDLGGGGGVSMIDTQRGLRELIKNQPGKLREIHKDTQTKIYDAQKGFAQTQVMERKALLQALKDIGIARTTKMMKLVQEYGEKAKSLEQVSKEVGPKKAQQVVAADQLFRATYDRMIDDINRVRERHGESFIEPREDYYRHMTEFSGEGLIEGLKDALGMEPTLTKGGGKLSILKKRTADIKTEVNALEGMLNYLPQYAWETNISPLKHFIKGAMNDLDVLTGDTAGEVLPSTKKFYDKILRDVSREKNIFDQRVEKMVSERFGRRGLKAYVGLKKASGLMIRNTVASLAPIVTNFAAYANAAGEIGAMDALRGAVRTINEIGKSKTSEKGYFVPERFESRASRKSSTKFWQRNKPLMGAFEVVDRNFITRPVWNAMYEKALRLGEADPVRYADIETGKIVGARSILDRADWYNSSIGRQLTPFTLEVNNYYRQVKGYLKGKGGSEASRSVAAWKLTKMMVASHIINMILGEITGNKVLFDPIQATVEALDADDPVQAMGRLVAEGINIFPGSNLAMQVVPQDWRKSLFGREDPGRYGLVQGKPIRAAGKLVKAGYRKLTGGKPVKGVGKAAFDLAGSLVPKLPGAQIKKTGQGIDVLMDDGKFQFGAVPVQIDTSNPLEVARLLMFGPYATKGFQEVANKKR